MRTFNRNLYTERLFIDGDGTRLKGDTWRELFENIRKYREINRLAPGDPEAEVNEQICARQPSFCGEQSPTVTIINAHSLTFNQRILQWFASLLALVRLHAVNFVPTEEANRRAAICSGCPKQLALNNSCGTCITSVDNARIAVLQSRNTHQNLLPCSVLDEDCATTVSLVLPPSDNPHLPANCWRK